MRKWLYLLTRAFEFEPDELADQLGDTAYREAIGVLEMISKSPEDLQFYEDRLKFLRDEQAKLDAARMEGLQEGEQAGLVKGRREGEQLGVVKGKLAGKIQTLQELLREPVSTDEQLLSQDAAALEALMLALQSRLKSRN